MAVLLILAFAVSLDSFSAGFTYGLRGMKLPIKSIAIIGLFSGITLIVAMLLGRWLSQFFDPTIGETLGGVILVLLGAWVLYQFFRPEKLTEEKLPHEKVIVKLELKSIGLVIQILKRPTEADFDKSGTITGIEAVMLGLALSLDAFGAGIGAALLGVSPLMLSTLVGCMCFIFLASGLKLGKWFSHISWLQRLSFLPGVILIVIGILKL
ncbi:sporulation membrane protein YtaF [Mangrovibacillus cuniculi]|uniref:Sporulation membrane protein YtaF n=1 Tax=Mangrovibacillus cuniculi TaxID=2593652 RepID=A0A7S8HFR6_9BACI|nr:sporulation membrane protein YtaF [Mangrovibacillus cuniculi]QPC47194.1 sporulation membrane protein YtaF [Mangrovibacillus cuniculi]